MATQAGNVNVGVGLELRLGLPCMGNESMEKNEKKRAFSETNSVGDGNSSTNDHHLDDHGGDVTNKSKKNQVVGWPPVCSYRKRASFNGRESSSKLYVKVSMDGAPILRKIDLTSHTHYSQLIIALDDLFHCFGIHGKALKDVDSTEFVPIYEDKDGDWMLVGDVPWEMFTESCKRLRIMKRADVKGIGLHVKSILKGTKNFDK